MTPSQDLVRGVELDDTYRLAKGLALSGMFPDAKSAEQALAKILIGRDLGLSPTQAMMGIHIVEGKPMVAAVTLGAFVRQSEHYDYKINQLDDERCELEFSYDGDPMGVSEFSIEDAKKAGLVKDRGGWAKYPRNMLFARAMSNGIRWYCPDATQGVAVYHEGEIEQGVSRDGLPRGSQEALGDPVEVSLDWVTLELEQDLALRLVTALAVASASRPGQLSNAVVEMSVRGQTRDAVEAFISQVEADNQAVPQDAVVVPDESDLPWGERKFDPEPIPADLDGGTLADMQGRLAKLRDRLDTEDLTPEQTELALEECEWLEREIGSVVPPEQEKLDV